MSDDEKGIDLLKRSIEEVAAALPPGTYPPVAASPTARRREASAAGRPIPRWAFAATAALLALLVYPAYLGLVELPSVRAELDRVHDRWRGTTNAPLELAVLTLPREASSVRAGVGAAPRARLELPPGETTLLLVELAPEWLEEPGGGGELVFEIRTAPPESDLVQRWTVAEKRVGSLMKEHEGVPLLLQGQGLPTGRLVMSLHRARGSESVPLSALELEVVNLGAAEP